jgi:beta-glucosidase
MSQMTLAEKVGQMTLVEKNSIEADDITAHTIGGILSGGGGYPQPNTPESWAEMVDGFQAAALAARLEIPLIYGVDAVHGHSNVVGMVIFPHNVGLGAANDPDLISEIGRVTALEMIATGNYRIDQGVADVDEATLRAVHLPPYEAAIAAGARSIMISYTSWGGLKMHAHQYLITDVLRGELGFDGFIVADWAGLTRLAMIIIRPLSLPLTLVWI